MLKKYNHEYVTLFLTFFILFSIPLQKITIYTLNYMKITRELYGIHLAYILWGISFLFLINYIISLILKKNKIDISDYIIFILSLLTIISTIFAVHQHKAIYGEINRFEGLLSLLSYYIIFLNLKNLKTKKIKDLIIKLFFIVGIVGVTYAFLQVFTDLPFIRKYSKPYMSHGLSGNPNFFGSLTVMLTVLSSVFYLQNNKIKYLLLSLFFMIGLTLSNSTGPLIGLIISLIYFTIIKKIKIKRILILGSSLILVFYSINFLNNKHQALKKVWVDPNFNTTS